MKVEILELLSYAAAPQPSANLEIIGNVFWGDESVYKILRYFYCYQNNSYDTWNITKYISKMSQNGSFCKKS
ncbi:MAG: hypothetical protein K5757_09105 [Bacteroidaceae bacterium]|nr:hypothetical protein [Bacteroidaceae bacterium]